MSQVYGFITQSGGEMVLESEVEKGTTVNIYLSIMAGVTDDTARDTVLIVKDEVDLREVVSELFRSIGYEALTAGNGHEAINILKQRSDINILFTDVGMPGGMSGIELAHVMRQLYPAVKVILASGYSLPALKAQHGILDNFVFMSKPYRLSELTKRLGATA